MVADNTPEQASDEELALRCQGADPETKRHLIGILANRHHRGLLNFVFGFVGDREVSEDLVQEAFIRIYRNIETYRSIAKFSTWAYRIARNLSLNEIRNRKRRPQLSLNISNSSDGSESDYVSTIASDAPEPQQILIRRDEIQEIREAIAEIPDTFRDVLLLCDIQKLSYQECADILDIKIGTVRSRLSRARTHFAEIVKRRRKERSTAAT